MSELRESLSRLAHEDHTHEEMLVRAGELLRREIPYAVAVWTTIDPVTCLPTGFLRGGDGQPLEADRIEKLVALEHETSDPGSMLDLLERPSPVFGMRADVADPMTVTRYREITSKLGSYDELRLALVEDGRPWGMLILHRAEFHGAFTRAELRTAAGLAPVLGRALRLAFLRAACAAPAGLDDPPGQIVARLGEGIVSSTGSADHWVKAIGGEHQLDLILAGLRSAFDTTGGAQVTVGTPVGPVAIHAGRLSGTDDVAVLMERPRALELTSVIASAYGLTGREREIAELVLRGLATKQVAAELGITPYTVNDHLKAVFAKTGTSTRAQLQWAMSSRFYLPPLVERCTPGPYGYYLDGEHVTRVVRARAGRANGHAANGHAPSSSVPAAPAP